MSGTLELKSCPKCGAPVPAEAPQGLCPKCLLLQASAPTETGEPSLAKPVPPTREQLAAAFPQLEILELIGQGGMGFVFKARQPKLERTVALKILPQSLACAPAFAERFAREGRVLARLDHPNIVTVYDFGQANGFFFLLMEYVDGVNLRQGMRAGRFTPARALAVVPKICEALQFAHDEGILHRDIKPENILLDAKGRVKIADFGIAKLLVGTAADSALPPAGSAASNLTETGRVIGTPHYMAPEQVEHPQDVDQRADIYSLGVVFYEMLTGELPLGRFAPPSAKSEVDARIDAIVLKALEKEREHRQRTAGEVKTQVETVAQTPRTSRGANSAVAPADHFWRRLAIGASVVLLLLVLVPALLLLGYFMLSWHKPERSGKPQIVRAETARVFGRINDLETGKPIAGARLVDHLVRELPSSLPGPGTLTDNQGLFDLRTMVIENHLITISAAGYETNSFEVVPGDFVNSTEHRADVQLRPIKLTQQTGISEISQPTDAPEKRDAEILRLKLAYAEKQLSEAAKRRDVGAISAGEYEKAKFDRDLARAELNGDPLEAAKLKFQFSEMKLKEAQQRRDTGTASAAEYDEAKLARDIAGVELSRARLLKPSAGLDARFKELEDLKAQLAELQTKYTDSHPAIVHLKERIKALERGL